MKMPLAIIQKPKLTIKRRYKISNLIFYVVAVILAIVFVFPLFWMVSLSLREESDIYQYPPKIIPEKVRWQNYVQVWNDPRMNISLYLRNTSIYAIVRTILQLSLASMAAFVLARYKFRGMDIIFTIILATVMIPDQVKLVPLFLMMKRVPLAGGNNIFGVGGTGWLDTFPGLIFPSVVSGYSIFLLRQFFKTVPQDLEDAARLDGCSEMAIYYRIALPMIKPALIAVGLFSFQFAWGDFSWPLIITSSERIKTLQLGLSVFATVDQTEWTLLMAGAAISALPIVIIFAFLQKYLATGISMSVEK